MVTKKENEMSNMLIGRELFETPAFDDATRKLLELNAELVEALAKKTIELEKATMVSLSGGSEDVEKALERFKAQGWEGALLIGYRGRGEGKGGIVAGEIANVTLVTGLNMLDAFRGELFDGHARAVSLALQDVEHCDAAPGFPEARHL